MRAIRVVTLTSALLMVGATAAQAAPTLQSDADGMVTAGVTSIVAQINDHGKLTSVSSGTAERGTNSPVSTNSKYRTGSVTKTFVSATILQLVGEGKVSLDDTVDRWLPGLITGNGNDGTKITVRQLLQHTSGLFEYILDDRFLATILTPEGFYANRYHTYTPQDLISLALAHPPDFAPGTSWEYSNTNYIVAGLIIKAVTGNTWDVEVTNRITKPLGLKDTTIPGTVATMPTPSAHAYNIWSPGVYSDTTEDNMTWADAAGAIITTTTDENKFFSALLSGNVLAPAQLTAMKTTIPISPKTGYGLGLAHTKLCNGDVWWHDGATIGYGTFVATTPDGARTFAFDVSTTDLTGSDARFDGAVNGAQDNMIRHVFCGTKATSDSMTAESNIMHGKAPIK